jgi:NAD+ diphosphatase
MATSSGLAEWRTCPRCGAVLLHDACSVSCPSCGLEEYANPAPTASALIEDEERRVLLARRAAEPGKGLWDLLGGFIEEGEEPHETLRRELREEIGLDIEVGEFLAGLPDRYGDDGASTVNFYWSARVGEGEARPEDDVAELAWFPKDALPPREEFAFANTIVLLERVGGVFAPSGVRENHPDG